MKNRLCKRTAAPAIACIVAFLAVCAHRAYGYNRMGLDRILLMNDDTKTYRAVTGQAYTNTDSSAEAWWVHVGPNPSALSAAAKARYPGTNHVFYARSGDRVKALWTLSNCRAGTAYSTSTNYTFVPFSSTAVPTRAKWGTTTQVNANCEVILLNIPDAYVMSSLYEEGIGTIYFDAVNSGIASLNETICLEIATNTVAGSSLTEDTPLDDYNWLAVDVEEYVVSNQSRIEKVPREDEATITLTATTPSGNEFFRIKKTLQFFGPIRFRIRRKTKSTSTNLESQADLIDIDNIIASYPVKTVEIREYGTYDDTLEGVAVRGWTPAFTTAFPAVGEPGVKGRVALEYFGDFTIPEAYGVTKDIEIKKVRMNYRWRYLDQITNAWTTVEMRNTDGEGVNWETVDDLELGDSVGDVEYSFSAELSSPYYLFGDYTGCDLAGYPADWTERITAVGRVADPEVSFADDDNNLSPAMGKDFFIRLREGVSQYEQVQLVHTDVKLAGEDEVVVADDDDEPAAPSMITNSLELVADHLWRGYLKIPTNHVESVDFHFVGLNLTENGATELAGNASNWKPVDGMVSDLPYSGLVEVTDAAQTATIAVDAAQGYLMFEFNDQFGTFTVTHADYQNFNLWTDIAKGNSFVGDVNEVTGVPRDKQDYSEFFTNAMIETSESLNTNEYSVEAFYGGNEANIQTSWQRNIPLIHSI